MPSRERDTGTAEEDSFAESDADEQTATDTLFAFLPEPKTAEEALQSEEAEEWQQAMESEMHALMNNQTCELVKLPADRRAISCRWLFKRKLGDNGSVARHKARLVVRGFSQIPGLDFMETFAPVARAESIRTILSIIAHEDLEACQLDVATAFLNAPVQDKIFMEQPPHFSDGTARVCRLKKSLYGLRQGPLDWNKHLQQLLVSLRLRQTQTDACVYTPREGRVIVGVFVDDLLVAAQTKEAMTAVVMGLSDKLQITCKELGKFIGFEIKRDRQEPSFSHRPLTSSTCSQRTARSQRNRAARQAMRTQS